MSTTCVLQIGVKDFRFFLVRLTSSHEFQQAYQQQKEPVIKRRPGTITIVQCYPTSEQTPRPRDRFLIAEICPAYRHGMDGMKLTQSSSEACSCASHPAGVRKCTRRSCCGGSQSRKCFRTRSPCRTPHGYSCPCRTHVPEERVRAR